MWTVSPGKLRRGESPIGKKAMRTLTSSSSVTVVIQLSTLLSHVVRRSIVSTLALDHPHRVVTLDPLISVTSHQIAHLAPFWLKSPAHAAKTPLSRIFDARKKKYPVVKHVENPWLVDSIDVKNLVIRLANVKTADRPATSRKRSVGTHAPNLVMPRQGVWNMTHVKLSSP